ncbi:MAG: GspH/FimT family pseudopilin [Gammaproteobacteria bacterium]|nr:GspH/FimT family pseudopilin [Gammaproteobacteria bacterium]MBU1440656.1 GspH/FimT family pseudopilin [Gammaproteobacteria bacterium]MBU2287143.1 GspH/FimT family pseudopilin [Gammaproteobacteria bacterium]MBU2409559.1 GspH/FimT family pseudopilin [Gammaproteobacteria bacterium]
MLVTMVVMALLFALAMPSMSGWIRNSRLRAASDSLQNGLRTAQAEALRRSRQTVFALTNDKPTTTGYSAAANGRNWAVSTVVSMATGETSAFIEAGVVSELDTTISITGPAAICFNSIGRMVVNTTPGVTGASCALPTTTPPVQVYDITYTNPVAGVDRPLRVTVALGGQVRLCDPAKTLSATYPEGCP